jgi:acyl carrier protein
MSSTQSTMQQVKYILTRALQLGSRAESFTESTRLLGNIPELDSMAVVTLVTALEEHFGFVVDDDEISAATFETLGALVRFVENKLES